jgi:predicted transcriptional regulator
MTQNVIHLPDDLMTELQAKAAAERKSFDELAEDAFRQYLERDRWQRLVASKREAARAKGLTEADVPRLIEEARRERRER